MIAFDLVVGYVFDRFGRKTLSIGGLFVSGIALMCFPLPHCWFAGYYIVRIIFSLSNLPAENSPYAVDYVRKESLGSYQAMKSLVTCGSAIIANSVAIYLQ